MRLPKLILFLISISLIPKYFLGQALDFNLTEANITNRTSASYDLNNGSLVKGIWGWPYIPQQKANSSTFSHTTISGATVPSSFLNFTLRTINGVVPTTNRATAVLYSQVWPVSAKVLSTTYQTFIQPMYNNDPHESGVIIMNYAVNNTGDYSSIAFQGGSYTNTILHSLSSGGNYTYINPTAGMTMNINVPSFTRWFYTNNSYTKTLAITDFTSGSDLEFDLSNFQIVHTVASYIDIKGQSNIVFTPEGGGATSTVPISIVQASGTGLTTTNLSTSYTVLNTTAYSVLAGNRTTVPVKIKIPFAQLQQYFYNPGTYAFNIDIRTRNSTSAYTDVKTISFTITTGSVYNIALQSSSDVSFTFASAADYQTGKTVNMPNHLLITNNKTYQVYVRATGNYFTLNGTPSTIPASVVTISNGDGETSVISRTLSTTPQTILTGATPVTNRNLSIRYTIPSSQTNFLFNNAGGATPYLNSVIYSFTNL